MSSKTAGICFIDFGDAIRLPGEAAFERFDGSGFIEVKKRVELLGDTCRKVMALPLGFRPVDDSDRPFEKRVMKQLGGFLLF